MVFSFLSLHGTVTDHLNKRTFEQFRGYLVNDYGPTLVRTL